MGAQALAFLVVGVVVAFVLPLPQRLSNTTSKLPIRIEDRNGKLLYELRQQDYGTTTQLALADIPQRIPQTVLAIEDRSFYSHAGVSLRGTVRALWQNLVSGSIVSGGSTITQQFVRMRMQPVHRGYLWKLREAWLALKLESRWSKDDILEGYLNEVYVGRQAYGLPAGSLAFFGKNLQELSLGEISLLVGLIQSPAGNDPAAHKDRAVQRRRRVLQAMASEGLITQEQLEEAATETIRLAPDRTTIAAPHFVHWLLEERGDTFAPGQIVKTTLDLDLQRSAERIVERRVMLLADKNVTDGAVVVLDAHNGDVLAMVGSADYYDTEHDGAVNVAVSARQPGSALKPFTYALALRNGATAATTVEDVAVQFVTQEGNPYTPRNYDFDVHGLVRYREALANSYNIAAVKVLQTVGVPALQTLLQRAGITTLTDSPEHYGLALTLGSGEVRLLELASAYGMFAREGVTLTPRVLLADPLVQGRRILDSSISWLIADILSDPTARLPEFGAAEALTVGGYRIAAKTGTTRNARDNWVVGFTPSYVVGVWVGNANNAPMKGTSGITGAGPIFHDVMETLLEQKPAEWLTKPKKITTLPVCRLSGKVPTEACPQTILEHFIAGTQPTEKDDVWKLEAVDKRNNLLAPPACPANFVEQKLFTQFSPELRSWAAEHGYKEPPTRYSLLCGTSSTSSVPLLFSSSHSSLSGVAQSAKSDPPFTITNPHTGDSFELDPLIPDSDELISLTAAAPSDIAEITWYIDGKAAGTGRAPDYRLDVFPALGKHAITAKTGDEEATVHIEVIDAR